MASPSAVLATASAPSGSSFSRPRRAPRRNCAKSGWTTYIVSASAVTSARCLRTGACPTTSIWIWTLVRSSAATGTARSQVRVPFFATIRWGPAGTFETTSAASERSWPTDASSTHASTPETVDVSARVPDCARAAGAQSPCARTMTTARLRALTIGSPGVPGEGSAGTVPPEFYRIGRPCTTAAPPGVE